MLHTPWMPKVFRKFKCRFLVVSLMLVAVLFYSVSYLNDARYCAPKHKLLHTDLLTNLHEIRVSIVARQEDDMGIMKSRSLAEIGLDDEKIFQEIKSQTLATVPSPACKPPNIIRAKQDRTSLNTMWVDKSAVLGLSLVFILSDDGRYLTILMNYTRLDRGYFGLQRFYNSSKYAREMSWLQRAYVMRVEDAEQRLHDLLKRGTPRLFRQPVGAVADH